MVTAARRAHLLGPAAAGVAVLLVVGGPMSFPLAAVVAVAVRSGLARLPAAATVAARSALRADLPLTLELLAAGLRAGAGLAPALTAAADAAGPPLRDELRLLAARLRLGDDPGRAVSRWAADPDLAPVARVLARAEVGGTPAADRLRRLAVRARARRRADADAAVRAVPVRAVGPLVCCFLPAFILVGVVPLVAGVLRGVRG